MKTITKLFLLAGALFLISLQAKAINFQQHHYADHIHTNLAKEVIATTPVAEDLDQNPRRCDVMLNATFVYGGVLVPTTILVTQDCSNLNDKLEKILFDKLIRNPFG